jgi:hypothetical protein
MGLTKDTIHERIKQLQTGNPFQLRPTLSHNVIDMRTAETILHQRYFQQRMRLEWFYFSSKSSYPIDVQDVIAYIENELDNEVDHRLLLKEIRV